MRLRNCVVVGLGDGCSLGLSEIVSGSCQVEVIAGSEYTVEALEVSVGSECVVVKTVSFLEGANDRQSVSSLLETATRVSVAWRSPSSIMDLTSEIFTYTSSKLYLNASYSFRREV